ncbi:MAG: hypothetical protein Q9169_005818 [Polycauliona sp. 2 TL-2023]
MASQNPKVAFAGLGAMGYGMASYLLKSAFSVKAFDVYQPTLDRFLASNPSVTSVAKTPREAVQDADLLIIMVATSIQATPLLFDSEIGAVQGLKKDACIIMCSTVAPAYIDEVSSRLKELGRQDIRLIDSPVSGGAARAANGTLSIFASASSTSDLANAKAILQAMSDERKLYEIPGGLGGGSKAKLIHQIFAGVNIAVASEAMGLAAVAGLDTKVVFEKVMAGMGGSWMFGNRVPFMLEKEGKGGYSSMTIIAKDVGIITQTARTAHFPLPLLSTATQLYLNAITNGWGTEDDCALVRLYLPPDQPDLVATQAGLSSSSSLASHSDITYETITHLTTAVHLASITEAMRFCEELGVETGLMYDIVSNAAGNSAVFEKYFSSMRENGWGIGGLEGEEREGILGGLAKAVEAAYALKYPLYLGNAALQELWRQRRESST